MDIVRWFQMADCDAVHPDMTTHDKKALTEFQQYYYNCCEVEAMRPNTGSE